MSVRQMQIERFTAFEKLTVDFLPGVNVLIGENATGKTHLMKLAYAMLKAFEAPELPAENGSARRSIALSDKLAGVFRPDSAELGRLVHRGVGRRSAKVRMEYDAEGHAWYTGFSLSSLGKLSPSASRQPLVATPPALFLPTREALAMYSGFIAAYEQRELEFDETYYDLCKALSAAPLRGPRLERAATLLRPLERTMGGRVVLKGGRFYVQSPEGMLEAPLLAEGYRKIASIMHLIANGSLMKNVVLFWDEPEANLNPKLVSKIAEVLRSLAAGGVQVILSTHDYLLSRELSLAAEYGTEPKVPIRFIALSRSPGGRVHLEAGEELADLKNNPILQEFAAHYDREQRLFSDEPEEANH